MKVTIKNISRKEKVSKKGNDYVSVGIQTEEHGDEWLNSFGDDVNCTWKRGDVVEIETEETDWGINFKALGSPNTGLEDRLTLLEKRVSKLEEDSIGDI